MTILKSGSPGRGHASPAEVLKSDPIAMALGGVLLVVLLGTAGIAIDSLATGTPLEESWTEIVLGVGAIVATGVALIRWRVRGVRDLLVRGRRVEARVVRCTSGAQFVHLRLAYRVDGHAVERTFLLGALGRAARLCGRSRVTLAVEPTRPRRGVVADVYEPADD